MKKELPSEVKRAISGVFDLLNSGDLPQAVAKAVFPKDSKPSSAWSFGNRLFCAIDWIYNKYDADLKKLESKARGTFLFSKLGEAFDEMDYRGINQWKEVKRAVNSGSNAAYILAPLMQKINKRYYRDEEGKITFLGKDDKAPEGKTEENRTINIAYAFKGVPVFSVTDTSGKPVVYKKLKLPELPYTAVAEFLGIKIIPQAFRNDYYGAFNPEMKTIVLCTPDQTTFFHELAHAVDGYILAFEGKKLKGGQQVDQELVAQFSANVIAYIRGYKIKESTAYTKKYIEGYAGKDAGELIIKLLARIERIVEFITNFKQAKSPNRQEEEKQGEPKSKTEELADNPKTPKLTKKSAREKVRKLFSEGSAEEMTKFADELKKDPNDDFEFRYADKLGGEEFLTYIRKAGKRTSELTKADIDRMYKNFKSRK